MKKFSLYLLFFALTPPLFAITQEQLDNLRLMRLAAVGIVSLVLLGGGLLALYIRYQRKPAPKPSFFRYFLTHPVVLTFGVGIGVIIAVNSFVPRPEHDSLAERLEMVKSRKIHEEAVRIYGYWLDQDPTNMDHHWGYISAMFQQGEWRTPGEVGNLYWHMEFPRYRYSQLILNPDPDLEDIGHWGLGLSYFYQGYMKSATDQFGQIQNWERKYFEYARGLVLLEQNRFAEAMDAFRAEVRNGGFVKGATTYLSGWHIAIGDLAGVDSLAADPVTGPVLNHEARTYLAVMHFDYPGYFGEVVGHWAAGLNWMGVIGAILGMLAWFIFLRRIDFFRPERLGPFILVLIAGGLMAFVALYFYDALKFFADFRLRGTFLNDFLFSVFGIGVVEELVKFLPWFLLWRFTRIIDEPVDLLVYAGASALGFSMVENMMYFDPYSLSLIFDRTLITILFHLFAAMVVAYGGILAKWRFKKPLARYMIPSFFLAALLHGFYDIWLINEGVSLFSFLSYVIFGMGSLLTAWMINNALNHSPYLDKRKRLNMGKLANLLFSGLAGVFLFEYISFSLAYGPDVANMSLPGILFGGGFISGMVVLSMSNIDIVKGEWKRFRPWNISTRVDHNQALGHRLKFRAFHPKSKMAKVFPISGTITDRVIVGGDNRFFLVRLQAPLPFKKYDPDHILIKSRMGIPITPDLDVQVGVILIRDLAAARSGKMKKQQVSFMDWAIAD